MNITIGLGYVGLRSACNSRANACGCWAWIDAKKVSRAQRGAQLHPAHRLRRNQKLVRAEECPPPPIFPSSRGTTILSVYPRRSKKITIPTWLLCSDRPDHREAFAAGAGDVEITVSRTTGELRAVLEAGSGMKAGRDFHLAYSPEREDPGNPRSRVADIPKVIGGLTPIC